jgi:hypothetical protein
MPAVCSSPFNDESSADTTFGQPSNAYDSTAMTRSLNLEPSPLVVGDGSAYGLAVQNAFRAMATRQHEEESEDLEATAALKTMSIIRPQNTPPNTPITPLKSPFLGSPVGGVGILSRDGTIRSRFNVDDWHRDGHMDHFRPQDSMSSTVDFQPKIPTSDEDVRVFLTSMEEEEQQGAFGSDPLELAEGIAVTEEAVELHVPDVITQS